MSGAGVMFPGPGGGPAAGRAVRGHHPVSGQVRRTARAAGRAGVAVRSGQVRAGPGRSGQVPAGPGRSRHGSGRFRQVPAGSGRSGHDSRHVPAHAGL